MKPIDYKALKKELEGKTILRVKEEPTGLTLFLNDNKTLNVEGESSYSIYITLTNNAGEYEYQP